MSKEIDKRRLRNSGGLKNYQGAPFPLERISPELHPYARVLRNAGYENLIPMLNEEVEGKVLYGLEKCLLQVLHDKNPSSQPRNRKIDDAKDIRAEVEKSIRRVAENGYFPEEIIPTIRVIPPEKLFGLCAPINLEEPIKSQLVLTDFGKAIHSLIDRRSGLDARPEFDRRTGISMFYIAGKARESAETKPSYRNYDRLSEKAYRISVIREGIGKDNQKNLHSDFDFLVVAPKKPGGYSMITSYEQIVRSLNNDSYRRDNYGRAEVKTSDRRPGFKRVELSTINMRRREYLGHIFGPAFKGTYAPENRLLPFLMESARADIPVLLIPYHHKGDGGWMFWGLAVDFFGGYQDVARHRLEQQSWLNREYSIALYPFPKITFPLDSPQELLFNLGYAFRTWAWGDKQPIMRLPHKPPITEDQLDKVENLDYLSRETQQFMTEQVIYPLSKMLRENNHRLGTGNQRVEFGMSLIEDIVVGLNGDPIATILRMLPPGVLGKSDHTYFDEKTNIYGFGIFDEKGLFPELGRLLTDRTILNKLKKEIFEHDENLERVKDGWGNKASGKSLLFNFLFEQAEGNSLKALDLLRPVWCNAEEWKTMMDKNFTRLTALDERFGIKVDKVSASEQVLKAVMTLQSPITAAEISAQSGKPIGTVFRVLSDLADHGELVRLGGQKTKNEIEQGGLGTGGFKSWFCTPVVNKKLVESGDIFPYLSPREKVVYVLGKTSGYTVKELMETTLLSVSVIYAVLKILEEEGKAERTGFINRNDLWAIKRDLKS